MFKKILEKLLNFLTNQEYTKRKKRIEQLNIIQQQMEFWSKEREKAYKAAMQAAAQNNVDEFKKQKKNFYIALNRFKKETQDL